MAIFGSIENIDIAGIDTSIDLTAVQVFVYDTSKDSDGGAWRYKRQSADWYSETLNTTKRGSRREFPAVAVIVLEQEQWTIYDGDDPSLPLWKRFIEGQDYAVGAAWENRTVDALNGKIVIGMHGTYGNIHIYDFAADKQSAYRQGGTGFIGGGGYGTQQDEPIGTYTAGGGGTRYYLPGSEKVNDVAMTVLPDAPIDPETGLPIPTIAVATDNRINIFTHDESPIFSSINGVTIPTVAIVGNKLFYNRPGAGDPVYMTDLEGIQNNFTGTLIWLYNSGTTFPARIYDGGKDLIIRSDRTNYGVGRMMLDDSGIISESHISDDHTTGWMPSGIQSCFSDTDSTNITGGELLTSAGSWTVTNGSNATGTDNTISYASSPDNTQLNTPGVLITGQTYKFTIVISSITAGSIRIFDGSNVIATISTAGTYTYDIKSTQASNAFRLTSVGASTTASATVTIYHTVIDRTEKGTNHNNSLIATGTIVRDPVATGAELVSYEGFDFGSTIYLYQPYNSNLAFGTGDFYLMWWHQSQNTLTQNRLLFGIYDPVSATRRLNIYQTVNGKMYVGINGGNPVSGPDYTFPGVNIWNHFVVTRKDGVIYIYRDGKLITSVANTTNIATSTTDEFRIGGLGSLGPNLSKFAIVRIGNSGPSAEHIKRIYEEEKHLFMDNAQCTLYGSDPSVQMVSYDKDSDLLHLGTAEGRSVFRGLKRIDNTTTSATVSISAINNMVVEE